MTWQDAELEAQELHDPEAHVPDYDRFEEEQLAQERHRELADLERELEEFIFRPFVGGQGKAFDYAPEISPQDLEAAQREPYSHTVRFDDDPEHSLVPALLVKGEVNVTVPPDTLVGHLGNVLAALEDVIIHAEPRTDDSDRVVDYATMRLEYAVRIASRIRAVHDVLHKAIARQAMLDTSARADNLPY